MICGIRGNSKKQIKRKLRQQNDRTASSASFLFCRKENFPIRDPNPPSTSLSLLTASMENCIVNLYVLVVIIIHIVRVTTSVLLFCYCELHQEHLHQTDWDKRRSIWFILGIFHNCRKWDVLKTFTSGWRLFRYCQITHLRTQLHSRPSVPHPYSTSVSFHHHQYDSKDKEKLLVITHHRIQKRTFSMNMLLNWYTKLKRITHKERK